MIAPSSFRTGVLVRAELRQRLADHKRGIEYGRYRDLGHAVRRAAAVAAEERAYEHALARGKWHAQQKTKAAKYWSKLREIITVDPCAYCGGVAKTIDHIVPRARGGTDDRRNLAPACKSCNSEKGKRTLEEWREWRLARMMPWPPLPKIKTAA